MTQRKALYGSTAVFIALANMAQADVTARQVWDNITNFYGAAGYEIMPGSVDEAGGSLTVSNLKISLPNPYAEMQQEFAMEASAMMPMLKMQEMNDGTVKITASDTYTFSIVLTPPGEDTGTLSFTLDQTGMNLMASGSPEKVTYEVSGPKLSLVLDAIDVPGEPEIKDAFDATMAMMNYAGKYVLGSGETPAMNMDFGADSLSMVVAGREPDGGDGRFDANVDMSGIAWVSSGVFAQGENVGDMTAMLRAGMTTTGVMSHSGSSYNVDFQDRRDAFAMTGSATSGAVDFDMGQEGISYSISNTGMDMKISGSDIPLPEIALAAAATKFGLTMPVLASDTSQDMGMSLRLEELAVSDMIWGMIDPGAQLPRDPATLILELAGKGNWLIDIMDPSAVPASDFEMPGALEAMDIKEMKLAIAGAEFTGMGGFTFDMNNLSTFNGIPAPTGSLDLQLNGANGLLDKLVAMGLLPQEQAMGARMMSGLFARPGDGPDSLVSKIEIDGASGSISANGQRLQ